VTRRLLFVDDDERILAGFRDRFRRLAGSWDMVFVTSGEAALAVLQAGPVFDLVVSDMRMPHMDGATLLKCVSRDYPAMVRVALTGYVDEDATDVRELAHAFLYKPCETRVLRETIVRLLDEHST
jgi:DNA-binding NtrC family response regulator